MPERLRPADFRFLAICCLLLTATVWFSARYFYRAFPEASIDFRVTREQARTRAENFLAAQGLQVNGYRQASRFSYDDEAKTFLERELGLDRANRLMGRRVRLWRWSWLWFRPLQKEEFRVDVTPAGEPAGFLHEIPEAAPGAALPAAQARAVAERFLRDTMHRDPAGLDFVEGSSVTRPARTDHTFTWKERDFDIHDATYRLEVTVQGGLVGGYHEYLKVPESWQRAYEGLRSRNLTAQTIDTGLLVLLAVALLVTILLRVRGHDVRWRRAAVVGGIGALLLFLSNWNAQPLAEFNYPTTDSYGSFVSQEFLRNLMGALSAAGLLFVLTAGAEPLYRQSYGTQLSLGNLFSARGLRTRKFLLGAVLGLTLAGIFVAYQTGFYMVAYHYGAWSPADVPYDDLLNTRLPWLFVLFGGFLPAVSEEFLFRMFAIPFLSKLLRSVGVAVVLAGFIWGFGHAGYPQQPFWIRGVEVGIGGVALGLIMLRWGILPTLVWHYSVDAMYTALLLLRSHNPYFVFSGAASAGIMVLPVLVALIAYLRHGGFASETGLTNADEGSAEVTAAESVDYEAVDQTAVLPSSVWSARRRLAAALVLIAGAVVLAAVHVQQFGDEPHYALRPAAARAIADQFARTQGFPGFSGGGYRAVAFPATKWDDENVRLAAKYFVERRDIAFVAGAFRRDAPLHSWIVRFFKPLAREELQVSVDPETGRVIAFHHVLPEDQAGADLQADAARRIAADFLASRGFDLQQLDLKETSSDKQKARRDHTLVWEARPGDPRNVDDAHFRVRMEVAGDRVASLRTYWKLPETFERARSQRNALSNVLLVVRIVVLACLLVLGIWLLLDGTRRRALRWGLALRIALPLAVLAAAASGLLFPLLFSNYDTAFPLQSFKVVLLTGLSIAALGLFVALACGAALILVLRPDALAVFHRAERRRLGLDAVFAAALAAVSIAALDRLQWLLIDRYHPQALLSVNAQMSYGTAAAALPNLAGACQSALFWLALVALIAHAVRSLQRWRGAVILAALAAAAAFVPSGVHNGSELSLYYISMLGWLAAAALFVKYFARGNYLAYLLTAWTLALLEKAADLLAQPADALRLQGALLIALLLATLLWAVAPALDRRKPITMVVRDPG
jgi:membrane protease YdiL (CAAX protease family)